MAGRTKPRRGVLLLIVLSLLVLFLLVGLSFLVSASQFNRLAKSASRTDNTGMPGAKLADAALLQLVRGTSNPYSSIHGHSLLEDLYGRDYIVITTDGNVSSPGTQQIQRVRVDLSDAKNYTLGQPLAEDAIHGAQELRDDYYNGCVLTFLNGTAKGMSTRVLAYKPNATPPQIVFQGIAAHNPATGEFEKPQKTNGQPLRFIINGRAFNGTGAGYNPSTGKLDLAVSGVPLALLPNYKSYRESSTFQRHLETKMSVTASRSGRRVVSNGDHVAFNYGGLDESWDGVDYQNFFLAKPADLEQAQIASTDDGVPRPPRREPGFEGMHPGFPLEMQEALLDYIKKTGGSTPSFHRPYLISYLKAFDSDLIDRFASARPSTAHHPSFSGSNTDFDAVNGPWDVDANGDGIPDSIWIDAGLAPVSGPDGRLYKPLVAAHVVDLDGRININAAGSLERAKFGKKPTQEFFQASGAVVPVNDLTEIKLPMRLANRAVFGSGYGPADISVGLSDLGTANLLRARYAGHRKDESQRNFESPLNPDTGEWFTDADRPPLQPSEAAVPGKGPADGRHPTSFSDDDLAYDSRTDLQLPYFFGADPGSDQDRASLDTGYGSPPDVHGRLIPYLDAYGNIAWTGGPFVDRYDSLDDPYEINLLNKDTHDNPFDFSDLEALLRFDLPNVEMQSRAVERLLAGGAELVSLQDYTTHSFSVPAPPTLQPSSYLGLLASRGRVVGAGLKRSMREVFSAHIMRVRAEGKSPGTFATAFAQAERIMAPELLRGEKIDLNRVLIPNRPLTQLRVSRNPTVQPHTLQERSQLLIEKEKFARHLFNLLMLVADQGHKRSFTPFPGRDGRLHHARRLAQWAINVVDFGDADSVMTRMRYDVNPFNEIEVFDAAGNVIDETELAIVWGMEYPEMVLTETLAFHDLRAADSEIGGGKVGDGDTDLDSNIQPEGAAFIELLSMSSQRLPAENQWHHVTRRLPEDISTRQSALRLYSRIGKTRKPTWRIAISEVQARESETPAAMLRRQSPYVSIFEPRPGPFEHQGMDLKLRRFVWFSGRGARPFTKSDDEENEDNTFLHNFGGANRSGQYLVIGPGNVVEVGLKLGDHERHLKSPQQVNLLQGDHRRVDGTRLRPLQQQVIDRLAEGWTGGLGMEVMTEAGGRFNISEPSGGYPVKSSPEPLDADSPFGLETRTISNFRTVFLQRLADPTAPWNPYEGRVGHDPKLPLNPYRTVDWMPIDLSVFNSLDENDDVPEDFVETFFVSREKSGTLRGDPDLRRDHFNVWSARTQRPPRVSRDRGIGQAVTATEDASLFSELNRTTNTNVVHSLGWLNRSFDFIGESYDGLGHYRADGAYAEVPHMPIDPATGLAQKVNLVGVEEHWSRYSSTYPTLVWNNRPYANPYELLMVPASSSSSLSAEYTVATAASLYGGGVGEESAYRGAFGHLLNFFYRGDRISGKGNYFRILDFVTVPSRFRDTQTWYRGNENEWTKLLWNNDRRRLDATSQLGLSVLPAALSKFREPGKINLNTATERAKLAVGFDSSLNEALSNIHSSAKDDFEFSMAWGQPKIERHTSHVLAGRFPNGRVPAEYPNPLRASVVGDLMPAGGILDPSTRQGLRELLSQPRNAIDGTLLRSRLPNTGGTPPILQASPFANLLSPSTNVATTLQNPNTNAYFHFRDLMKLGNSVTSQSNVYAIWITIGYFEIEPNINEATGEVFAVDAAHPDGYRFGIEMGSDVGQVTRHRAFYVVDRSIPVAFEPGKNHNVEKAILLRRHLE